MRMRRHARGIAILAVSGLLGLAISLSPVGAAPSVKKIAKKLIAQDNAKREGIFLASKAGPVALPPPPGSEVAKVTVPAGSYGVTAKARVRTTSGSSGQVVATCRLLTDGVERDLATQTIVVPGSAGLTLVGGHTSGAPGTLSLNCDVFTAGQTAEISNIKILAVRGPTLTTLSA